MDYAGEGIGKRILPGKKEVAVRGEGRRRAHETSLRAIESRKLSS